MNKTNIVTVILLVVAIVLGALNLKIYSSLAPNGGQTQGGALQNNPAAVHNATGTLVSLSSDSLMMNIGNKNISLTLGNPMNYYLRTKMSEAKYQAALSATQKNSVPKQIKGDATGGVYEIAMAPIQDVLNQVKSIGELNLKAGDSVTVAFNGKLADGTVLLEIVKVVEVK